MKINTKMGAIILAAGKGRRMKSKHINKVAIPLDDKPMILHTVELMKKLNLMPIVVVVGFAKKSIMNVLGNNVLYAEQKKRLGTGHAALCGLTKIPPFVTDVLIVNGDDSAFYNTETISKLIEKHISTSSSVTFLTIRLENPQGLGRVLRNDKGSIVGIKEEKDASDEQKRIHEINPGCYVFKTSFLKTFLPKIKKSPVTREYYLVTLVELAAKNNKKIETVTQEKMPWRGVNTKEELEEARKLFTRRIAFYEK